MKVLLEGDETTNCLVETDPLLLAELISGEPRSMKSKPLKRGRSPRKYSLAIF